MSFVEFIKNPSSFIWGFVDKKKNNNTSPSTNINSSISENSSIVSASNISNQKSMDSNLIIILKSDFEGFVKAIESKDWKWLFRGKTGLFLKISIPTILLIYFVSVIFSPNPTIVPKDDAPSVIDPGDTFNKPKFKSSNYLNGSFSNGKFLTYSPEARQINEFGLRGILLDSSSTDNSINYYYPLSKKSFLFYKEGKLIMRYMKVVVIPDTYPKKTKEEEDFITILENLEEISKLKNVHVTYDNNFSFILDNSLYVYNFSGQKIKEYSLKSDTISPTFFNGEVYFVKEVPSSVTLTNDSTSTRIIRNRESNSTFYLIRLNKNDEEVYSQNLGNLRVQKISVVNEDRYLILIERPSENSFFNIQMRDSGKRTIFNVSPFEKEVKITLVNNFYFNNEDNTIFMQGNGVAKLFNLKGEQLWIN